MSVRNKLVKVLGYIGIYLLALLESYLFCLVTTGTVTSLICMVWSFFAPLPELLRNQYGLVMLTVSALPSVILSIYVMCKAK